jgi:hypothetical protein
MKVVAAVSELEQDYGDRVYFNVISAEETARRQDEIKAFGFEAKRHGLVVFTSDGEPLVKVPGHQISREQIEALVKALLAAG